MAGPSDAQPRWSPDGSQLAFVSKRDGDRRQLYVIPVAGGEATRLTELKEDVGEPTWAPDGTRIAFQAVDQNPGEVATPLAVLDIATGDVHTIPQTDGYWRSFDWSPDGTRFALAGGPLDENNAISSDALGIYVVSVEGNDLHPILHGMTARFVRWAPDGTRLAFGLLRADTGDYRYDVATVAPDGSDLSVLTSWRGWDNVPVWSPDGRWIAFSSDRDASPTQLDINASRADGETGAFGVYVIRADGTNVEVLVPSGDEELKAPVDWRAA